MAMAMTACNTRQQLAEVNPDRVKYFMEKLLLQIYEHFDEQEIIDVTFKLSNPTALVTAHRLILSAASPYFKELFKSENGLCPLIEITEIDSETFERLITFCYTGKTLITIDNVDKMLKAAIILKLDDAVANCTDFVMDHMTDYTLRRAYALENETQADLLSQKLAKYKIRNFMEFIKSTEFLNLDPKKLQKILESDELNVPSENYVFEAVKRWYEHDPSAREKQLPDLIGCLRLTQFDTNYIMSNIHPLPGCKLLALETSTWHNHPLTRSQLELKYTKPREATVVEEFLALNKTQSGDGGIYQYNKTENAWQKWHDIKIGLYNCDVIILNETLIFLGGSEVKSWNFKTKTFKQLPSLIHPRIEPSAVVLNDKIYVIGGRHNNTLHSVETYSLFNGYHEISSMITARYGAAAVTFEGKIYVIGGRNNNGTLKSVERYDPKTDCWTQCADMNEGHYNPGATVHKQQIFVIGGSFGGGRIVERYDPYWNKWTKICYLPTELYNLSCISIYNQLWTVGSSGCVYAYDDQNDKWIEKSRLPSTGSTYCFTVPKALLQSDQQISEE